MKIPELPSAKAVSTKRLRSVWKRISDKPLPDVYAFTLEENEFLSNFELVAEEQGGNRYKGKRVCARIDFLKNQHDLTLNLN